MFAEPTFALDKVEEHAAVEELQGEVVRPLTILYLSRQVVLKALEDRFVVFKESLCDGFNIEGCFMTGLDFEGRNGFEKRADGFQVEHSNPLGRGAEFLVRADCDAAEQSAFFGIVRIVLDIDKVPVRLIAVAEDEQGVGVITQETRDDGSFSRQEQTVGVEMGVDDMESAVRSAGCKKDWIVGEGVPALIGERDVTVVVV